MTLHHFECSREIARLKEERNWPYYALIQAAMRLADPYNEGKLKSVFPEVWADLQARYDAPGGLLAGEAVLR